MKIRFYADTGFAGCVHEEHLEESDLGLEEGGWDTLSDDGRDKLVREWALNFMDFGYESLSGSDE